MPPACPPGRALVRREFVTENATGLDALATAVAGFTPEVVAARADVPAGDLVEAARLFGQARRGYAATGVGAGFAASSTLVHYLVLTLDAVCGHYLRAGEQVKRTVVLRPRAEYRAQASPPRKAYGYGPRLRVSGRSESAAGVPTAFAADEMLGDDRRRVRALISCGGNPLNAWPDQLKTIEAMKRLDLLVHVDPWMTPMARLADVVIAPTMTFEVPSATLMTDMLVTTSHWYGPSIAYGQYGPAVVAPPEGSDVMGEYAFFHGLAQRLGLKLVLDTPLGPHPVDMSVLPTVDDVIELLARDSRIPLDEVKRHPSRATFVDPAEHVLPKEPGWAGRLDVGNPDIMRDLADVLASPALETRLGRTRRWPFRFINRRIQRTFNSDAERACYEQGPGLQPCMDAP